MLGFPIRTPPDHSLVANSPGLIAGSNVLHRLLMPRHPPCALHSLSQQRQDNTQKTHQPTPQSKEQASTQKRHDQPRNSQSCLRNYIHQHTPRNTHVKHALTDQLQDARVHYADLKQQPHQHPPHPSQTPPTGTNPQGHPEHTGMRNKGRTRSNQPPPPASGGTPTRAGAPPPVSGGRLILQDPTVCLTPSPTNAGP